MHGGGFAQGDVHFSGGAAGNPAGADSHTSTSIPAPADFGGGDRHRLQSAASAVATMDQAPDSVGTGGDADGADAAGGAGSDPDRAAERRTGAAGGTHTGADRASRRLFCLCPSP